MEQKDKIKELFSEKLGNFESSVRPELWSSIASQIGTTSTVTAVSTGVSLFTKTIIGVSVAAAIGGFVYFSGKNNNQQSEKKEIETAANQTRKTESSSLKSANQTNKITQSNLIDDNRIIDQSLEPFVGGYDLPTTEDFLDVLTENKELPMSYVQLAEAKSPNFIEEVKQEKSEIIEDHPSEDPINQSQSSTVSEIEKVIVELPNVFSPNNDGANDYFEVKCAGLKDFSLVVLDKSGKLVFQTTEIGFKWDGMNLSNEKVMDGNYLYYITARDAEGKLISKSQTLMITTQR